MLAGDVERPYALAMSNDEAETSADDKLDAIRAAYATLVTQGHDDVRKLVPLLLEEVDQVLRSGEWRLVKKWETLAPVHGAAALRQCALLLKSLYAIYANGLVDHGGGGVEFVMRVLGRNFVETWLKGLYLTWAGEEALDALAGDYQSAVEKTTNAVAAYNDAIGAAARAASRQNRGARSANVDRKNRNELYPDLPPLPLVDEIPRSPRQKLMVDLSGALAGAQTDVSADDMLLVEVARRVDQLADERGDNVSAEAVYVAVYRALSTYGGHTSLALLDSYLNHDARLCFYVAEEPHLASSGQWLVESAMTWTAMLAKRLFATRDVGCPVAEFVEDLGRLRAFAKQQGPEPSASTTTGAAASYEKA